MTSKPVVVVLSRDQQLTGDFPALLGGQIDIRACDSLEELTDLARQVTPQGLVVDFRRARPSENNSERLLETIQQRFPEARLALLTGDDCPPPRSAASAGVSHFRGAIDVKALAGLFRQLYEKPDAVEQHAAPLGEPPPEPPQNEEQPAAELNGTSRRFETYCPRLKQMLDDLAVAARHDVTILLIGETGSGKTYLSRLIHEMSSRRHEPFLPVACGALPGELIESELFGHVKGAFTSAHIDKEGKFIAARRGTLLLDEIDVLPPEQQVKLLRVIETGEFEPVGSNQTLHLQARLVVASNLNLQPLVERGQFRPDLYYRLNMLKFEIPPLRQRKEDIIPLAKKFIRRFAIKHQVRIETIEVSLFNTLLTYPWPGNVRELENVMQRAVIYSKQSVLTAEQLPPHIVSGRAGPANDPSVVFERSPAPAAPDSARLGDQIALTEREIIEQTLFKNSFSRTKTAKELGISRVTLYNKMKRYGISR